MSKYVLTYTGGAMAESPEAQEAAMAAWVGWFSTLGGDLVDAGNPFGPSLSVAASGAITDGGSSQLTGYSIIEADNLGAASEKASTCPVLANGGAIEVYEAIPIG